MFTTDTPTRHDPPYNGGNSSLIQDPITLQPSLRRKATDEVTPPASKKQVRQYSSLGMDNGMQLVRLTVGGMQIPLEQAVNPGIEEEEEEDEFVDASEELENEVSQPRPRVLDMVDEDDDNDNDDDEDDLFSRMTKGPAVATNNEEDGSDQEAHDDVRTQGTHRVVECDCVDGEHYELCRHARNASTPPSSPSQIIKKERSHSLEALQIIGSKAKIAVPPKLPVEADFDKSYRKNLAQFRRWHERMKQYIPDLPLAGHRYWIGILPTNRQPRSATSEKHMTWMKGNRVTTISTVWHRLVELTMDDKFELMLGTEKLQMTDRMEELDVFNEKFICLRAVARNDPAKKGRPMTEGLVPEVVELIDED